LIVILLLEVDISMYIFLDVFASSHSRRAYKYQNKKAKNTQIHERDKNILL